MKNIRIEEQYCICVGTIAFGTSMIATLSV